MKKPWYRRPVVILWLVLSISTFGALLPTFVSSLRKSRFSRLIAGFNLLSLVVSAMLDSPFTLAVFWLGNMLVAFLTPTEGDKADEQPDTEISVTVDPESKDLMNYEKSPTNGLAEATEGQESRTDQSAELVWSKKARRAQSRIELSLQAILIADEQILGVAAVNRVRGPMVDFAIATNARLILINSKSDSEKIAEFVLWSHLVELEIKSLLMSTKWIKGKSRDGRIVRCGQLTERSSEKGFIKLIEKLRQFQPRLDLEAIIERNDKSSTERNSLSNVEAQSEFRGDRVLKLDEDRNEVDNRSEAIESSGPSISWFSYKFKWKKKIQITKESFQNEFIKNAAMKNARIRFEQQMISIDRSLFNSENPGSIYSTGGCVLIEVRKGARVTHRESTYTGTSSGGSVGYRGVRVGGGSSSGFSSSTSVSYPAPDELTIIDRGKFLISNLGVSFAGKMFTKTTDFKKIVDFSSKGRQILIAPKSGSKVWIAELPNIEDVWIAMALLDAGCQTPEKRLDEKATTIYESIFEEVIANCKRTLTEVDIAVAESDDELELFRDVLNEYRRILPKKVKHPDEYLIAIGEQAEDMRVNDELVRVVLVSVPALTSQRIALAGAIKSMMQLKLGDIKVAIDNSPAVLAESWDRLSAETIQLELRKLGAEVELQ